MGSACCVAARDTALSNGESQRNTICSPSSRFFLDNYRHVLAETDNTSFQPFERISTYARMEMKDGTGSERRNISDRSSDLEILEPLVSQKYRPYEGTSTNYLSPSGPHLWKKPQVRCDDGLPLVAFEAV